MMNDVIDRLADIEKAAVSIIENANHQKAVLAKDMEQKTLLFDKELEESTAQKITTMTDEMNIEIQDRLAALQEEADKTIQHLEQDYNQNHTSVAKHILNTLTGG